MCPQDTMAQWLVASVPGLKSRPTSHWLNDPRQAPERPGAPVLICKMGVIISLVLGRAVEEMNEIMQ